MPAAPGAGSLAWPLALSLRQTAAEASLLLLVGGLAMLLLIIVLVVIESLVPVRQATGNPLRRELRPMEGVARRAPPADDARLPRMTPIDQALGHLVEEGVGEPRILRHSTGKSTLRIYGCRSCTPAADGTVPLPPSMPCRSEARQVEEAFRRVLRRRVLVREVACCRRGQGACDFEVRA